MYDGMSMETVYTWSPGQSLAVINFPGLSVIVLFNMVVVCCVIVGPWTLVCKVAKAMSGTCLTEWLYDMSTCVLKMTYTTVK